MDKVTNCSNNQTIAEYVYDYTGKRMVKRNFSEGNLYSTVVSWSDGFETKIYADSSPAENTSYYFANNELIAKKNSDGSRYYIHNDHLGSANIITNQSGEVVEETKYDPFGKVSAGGTLSKFQYTGQEKDAETGLNYYDSRYYSSDIKRFIQPDTILPNVYDPQQLNRYSYARNNPMKYVDPTGHVNEILAYNNALNAYYKKPSAITYNNVLTVASNIQKQSSKPSQSSGGGNNGGSTSGGGGNTSGSGNNNKSNPNILTLKQNAQEAAKHKFNILYHPYVNIYNSLWFANKVREGGDWDYKHKDSDLADFGNFNYGYTGREAGYSTEVLQRMGGTVQQLTNLSAPVTGYGIVKTKNMPWSGYPYGDSFENGRSVDQEMIKLGADSYINSW